VKAGQPEFDYIPEFGQTAQTFAYLEQTYLDSDVRVKPNTKEQPVETLNIRYVLEKGPPEGPALLYLALHMYEFYQSGVEATIVRLTAAKNTGTLVGAAAIYAVPNSVKTELWMASVKKKFQRVLTLYPSLNFAASVKKSRRLCNFGDPSALQLYFIVEGHLDRISKHTEWRDLQNERSKVYEEYMNATYESLYKAVPMLQSSKSELHRLSFDSFIIHKDGNINGVFTLIVDAVHLKKIGTVDSYFTINSDVPPGAVFPSRSDPLTKFQVNFKTAYRGNEQCWLDNTPPPTEPPKATEPPK
ncbi:hypothetical protein CSKR_110590, partial [Clonorchis sinensis]